MSDTDTTPVTTATADSDLAPPDDFGAAIIAEFEKRGMETRPFGQGGAAMLDGSSDQAEPPGGWPVITPAPTDTAATVAEHETGQVTEALTEPEAPTEEPGVPAPAPDASPELPVAAAPEPAQDAPADVSAEGASAGATIVTGYQWNEGDQSATFTDEQVRGALALSAWAEQLPEPTRTAFAAIEQGQAVAIARADYDAFQAWKGEQTRSTRDADLTRLDVDPEVAQVITGLRDELAALKAGTPVPAPLGAPGEFQNTNANLDATAQRMDAAARTYATDRGLTEAEFSTLFQAAVNAQVIPSIAENLAQRNPATGQIIRPADPGEVIAQALDFALIRDPGLHTAVLSRRQANPAGQPSVTAPDDFAVTAKKARASSVASAPSAAVTPSPRNPATRTSQEVIAAMEAELAEAMKAG